MCMHHTPLPLHEENRSHLKKLEWNDVKTPFLHLPLELAVSLFNSQRVVTDYGCKPTQAYRAFPARQSWGVRELRQPTLAKVIP